MTKHVQGLSDDQLLAEVGRAVADERVAAVALIRLLGEVEERGLHFSQGYSSMFLFCVHELRLSEHAAYGRIAAARASRRHPALLDLLEKGEITLTTITLLSPHLEEENAEQLIEASRRKTKEELTRMLADLTVQPHIPSSVRRLPARSAAARSAIPVGSAMKDVPLLSAAAEPAGHIFDAPVVTTPAIMAPLSSERYLIKMTVSRETRDRLQRAQDLLRHAIPDGDPAAVIDRALAVLVDQLERQKVGKADRPRPAGSSRPRARHVPASVRREVWKRDGGRCAFVGGRGRCGATAFLEFHHVRPFAVGGEATVENQSLRCRAHNGHEARMFFDDDPTRSGPS